MRKHRNEQNKFFFMDIPSREILTAEAKVSPREQNNSSRGPGWLQQLVSAVIVAFGSTVDAACRIAEAEFAAAFVITAAGAELRAIEG